MTFLAYNYKVSPWQRRCSPVLQGTIQLPQALTFSLLSLSSLNLYNPLCTLFLVACERGLKDKSPFDFVVLIHLKSPSALSPG